MINLCNAGYVCLEIDFFTTCMCLWGNLWVRLATQHKSPPKINLRLLATTRRKIFSLWWHVVFLFNSYDITYSERNQEEYSNWFLTERSQTTVRDGWCDSIAISNISSYKVDGNTHELEYSLLCESTHFLVQLLFPSDCSESPWIPCACYTLNRK